MANKEIQVLKEDEYYLFYGMMMNALKTDDVINGIDKSLFLLKGFLNSGNISLYKKSDDSYVYHISDATLNHPVKNTSCIVNKTSKLIEKKEIYSVDLNLSNEYKNMILIHLNTQANDYILSINNYGGKRILNDSFWYKLKDVMQVLLKRSESYENNMKAISTDLLTGLDNRNSYEMRLQQIDESHSDMVYGLFDIFRLKYINDNYSHAIGDIYIKEVAKILNRYWPKEKIEIVDDTEQTIPTGHCIYRVGGDEFVLITNREYTELARIKAGLAHEESQMIDLGIGGRIPIGINFGIVEHVPGDLIKKTYMKADALMSENKRKMYLKYGITRRK